MPRAIRQLLVVAIILGASPSALANGRFPESNQIFFAPNDDQLVILRTTFGALLSHDRGATWEWICESVFPLIGSEDPMFAVTPKGTMLATTVQGVSISKSSGCDWENATGLDGQVFIDLASTASNPGRVVVFSTTYAGDDGDGGFTFSTRLWETTNEGSSFQPLGAPLEPTLVGSTVDLTNSDPDRLYVTAGRIVDGSRATFFVTSRDRGRTWRESRIAFEDIEHGAFIAGVDPANADRVYVRTANGGDRPSRLLVTDDAGITWRTAYRANGPLLGFALSRDGTRVFIGGPRDGIRTASTTDFVFEQRSTTNVQCLALASDGLWTCSTENNGFIVAVSKDEGVTFEKKTRFCDIRGSLSCPAASESAKECVDRWPGQRSFLGCGPPIDPTPDAGAPDAGGAPAVLLVPSGGCDCGMTRLARAGGAVSTLIGTLGAFLASRRRRS